jgi:uncharacterized protein (TIGR02466 family)
MYAESPVKEGNFYHTGFTTYFYDDFTGHLYTHELFNELRDMIIREANKFVTKRYEHLEQHGKIVFKNIRPLRFTNMWFNVNPPGGYQGRHHHAMNLLGGTYYLDVPDESGKIGFYDPNQFAYFHNQDHNAMNLLIPDFDVQTSTGDLLIWPGWMDHEISVNKTADKNRLSISFGINWA